MTVFSGQMENAGHFAHPTASAMGQSVMMAPLAVKGPAYAVVARLSGPSVGPPEGDEAAGRSEVNLPSCGQVLPVAYDGFGTVR